MNTIQFDDTDSKFTEATQKVHTLPKRPSDDILLKLYGLYKQATEGNNRTSQPIITDFKGRAKWNAWKTQAGKGKSTAKKEYLELVNDLL